MNEKDEEVTVNEENASSTEETGTEETTSETNASADAEETGEGKEYGESETVDPLISLQQEVQKEKEKYLRIYAEFENFRRRTAKERIELIGSAAGDLMKEILPVLDDFERAIEVNKEAEDITAVKEGFDLLYSKLSTLLSNKGLKPIESKGVDFDSEVHEAIAQIPAPSDDMKGKIIDVVERGYELNEKIIRHPKVVVGT